MKLVAYSALLAAMLTAAPLVANAASAEMITRNTTEIDGNYRLTPGASWTVYYNVSEPFFLNLSFSGTGRKASLQDVTYGLNIADKHYEGIYGTTTASSGYGVLENVRIDQSFSIEYALASTAKLPANVTYYGEVTAVPEITAEGAFPAILLVIGSVAAIAGTRKRETIA